MPTDHTSRDNPAPAGAGSRGRPLGLVVAALVVAAQALAPVVFAIWMMVRHGSETPSNESVYEGATIYLIVLGLMVSAIAFGLWRRRGWSFGAAVFVQLLALAVTYEMTDSGFWAGAVPLGVAAIGCLALLFTTPVRTALGRMPSQASPTT